MKTYKKQKKQKKQKKIYKKQKKTYKKKNKTVRKQKKRKKQKRKTPNPKLKSGFKVKQLFKKMKTIKNKGKDMIKSLTQWTDLPSNINKGSKCEFCKKENTLQYIRSGDFIDIATQNIPIYYRCKACKILKL